MYVAKYIFLQVTYTYLATKRNLCVSAQGMLDQQAPQIKLPNICQSKRTVEPINPEILYFILVYFY